MGWNTNLSMCFLYSKEVVHMNSDWDWRNYILNRKEEENKYELWKFWWTICTAETER